MLLSDHDGAILTGDREQCQEGGDQFYAIMAGFPFDGTWGLSALVTFASNASSHMAWDGSTRSDNNSLTASDTSGVDGSAMAALQWLSLSGKSNGAGLNRSLLRARASRQLVSLSGPAWVALCRHLCD